MERSETPGSSTTKTAEPAERPAEALGSDYGLATQVWKTDFGKSCGHGGWFPGYLSQMEYFPAEKIAVAIQFNTDAVRQLKKGPRRYLLDIARIVISENTLKKAK